MPSPQSASDPSENLNHPPEHAPQELSTWATVMASEAREHEEKHCSYSKSPHEVV